MNADCLRLSASRRRRCFAVRSRLRLAVKRVFLCVLLLTLSLRVSHANDLRTLVTESCLDCHDDAGKAGGLSLEQLGFEMTQQNVATWLRSLEQIERGYMPPLFDRSNFLTCFKTRRRIDIGKAVFSAKSSRRDELPQYCSSRSLRAREDSSVSKSPRFTIEVLEV